MWVSLIDLGRIPIVKKFLISLVIAGCTVIQLDWKKLAEKPLGPGVFSWWMEINLSFAACEIEGCITRDTISEQSELEDVKIIWK